VCFDELNRLTAEDIKTVSESGRGFFATCNPYCEGRTDVKELDIASIDMSLPPYELIAAAMLYKEGINGGEKLGATLNAIFNECKAKLSV